MADKKYYWLKLKRDFFKRHDIQIIESVPNGKDYVLFYLKLLAESIDHEGLLRFNDLIPYSEQMLSTITNTNIDVVRSAITLLKQLDLIEILDDQTIFVKDTAKMMGEGSSTERVRRFRDRKSQRLLTESVTETLHETEIEIEKEKELEIDKEIKANKSPHITFKKPTVDEILKYCGERNNLVDPVRFFDFYESKGWMIGKTKMKDWKAAVRTWEKGESVKPYSGPVKTEGGTFKL